MHLPLPLPRFRGPRPPLRQEFSTPLLDAFQPVGKLGSGCHKEVQRVRAAASGAVGPPGPGDELALRALHRSWNLLDGTFGREPTDPLYQDRFLEEHANLKKARLEYQLPAAQPLAVGSAEGRPADVMPLMATGSRSLDELRLKCLWSRRARQAYRVKVQALFSGEQGASALGDLEKFREAFGNGVVLPDFQLMFRPGEAVLMDVAGLYEAGEVKGVRGKVATRFWQWWQARMLDRAFRSVEDGMGAGPAP